MSAIAEYSDAWLILSEPGDPTADWVKVGLAQRRHESCVVTTRDLTTATNWVHSVRTESVGTIFSTEGGLRLCADRFGHALSLISYLPPRPAEAFAAPDREYASQEWIAFIVSALAAVPNWVNPIGPGGLAGRYRSGPEWTLLAHEVGLLCETGDIARRARTRERNREVLVLGGHVFSQGVPSVIKRRVCELFSLADIRLGGARFCVDGRRWRFLDATGTPECMAGGALLLDALADM
jgi:hypothetical protein